MNRAIGGASKRTLKLHPAQGFKDGRPEMGQQLEPYAIFDKDIEKFCCCKCGSQFETYRGIEAHLFTTRCGE